MVVLKSSLNSQFAGRVTTVRASTYKFMFLEINLYFDMNKINGNLIRVLVRLRSLQGNSPVNGKGKLEQ